MYFITTKRMLEVCFFQHTPTFIIEPDLFTMKRKPLQMQRTAKRSRKTAKAVPGISIRSDSILQITARCHRKALLTSQGKRTYLSRSAQP